MGAESIRDTDSVRGGLVRRELPRGIRRSGLPARKRREIGLIVQLNDLFALLLARSVLRNLVDGDHWIDVLVRARSDDFNPQRAAALRREGKPVRVELAADFSRQLDLL